MAKQTKQEPEEKQFGLKPIELNLIGNSQARAQQALFDICTFIAVERLAYPVDKQTTFRVENGMLIIGRLPEAPEASQADTGEQNVSVA